MLRDKIVFNFCNPTNCLSFTMSFVFVLNDGYNIMPNASVSIFVKQENILK